ncbi:MAG: SDR family oxidoreductase [Burkholderiaceae bacterium]
MKELQSRVALVTGASRGIGASTAIELSRLGVHVMLAARNVGQCETIAAQIRQDGHSARAIACDVTDYQQVQAAVDQCISHFGGLDIVVNNAGVIEPIGRLIDSDPHDWALAADINFRGVYNGIRAALPVFVARQAGTIINISSGAAHRALEGWSHYCAAKAAAAMLTESTHLECAAAGVRVFGLSPGTVATEMQVLIKASGLNPVSQLDPSVHIDPAWPARAVAWLCTGAADRYRGEEVSLRDNAIQKEIGLIDP